MRAFRAVAAVLLSAVVLAGCGPSGSSSGTLTGSPSRAPSEPLSGPPSGSPSASPSATATAAASPTAGTSPDAAETLVRVTRSGGFAGRTHTVIVKGDGSWTRLDAKAKPTGTGKMSPEDLDALRAALKKADFPHLPRVSTGGPVVYDGYMYAFVHGGFEVATDDGSMPPALAGVLSALPGFEG
ncbi:hypothetical protein [Streptomyces sp. NPDC059874]|uniref:hypothetical protein n=1 Tax=Streptomyces sp. NPDC059874 TaxID=3346983 RepID=UPI003669F64E